VTAGMPGLVRKIQVPGFPPYRPVRAMPLRLAAVVFLPLLLEPEQERARAPACRPGWIATGMTEWECTWTTLLPGGHLTVEGPFFDNGTNTTLAITGGTGSYTGAEGSVLLHATGHPVGSEFDFIFTLTH